MHGECRRGARPGWSCAAVGLSVLAWLLAAAPAGAQGFAPVGVIRSSGPVTSEASRKLVAQLRGLLADFRALGITRSNAAGFGAADRFSSETLHVDQTGRVQVYVYVVDTTGPVLSVLHQHGLDVELVNATLGIVQGWIAVEDLEALAGESVVVKIRPPSYAMLRTGTVTSQGDAILRCDQVRAGTGITGAGIKVGVVSDGVASLAVSQAMGELPAVQVLNPGSGDEGTALLEIVADCAPGAALAFSSGFPTSLDFIASVNGLQAAGAQVVVDDVGFYGESFFGVGPVAANDRVAGTNGFRASSAGNDRETHYQGVFVPGVFDSETGGTRHAFAAGDTLMRFSVPAGRTAVIVLQWLNQFGAAGDDYNLCVRQPNGTLLTCSAFKQDGNDDPIEAVGLRCLGAPGSACLGDIQIDLAAGSPRPLKLFCLRCQRLEEFGVAAGSIFGHPAMPEVFAVAATPASNPTVIEPFSSAGPSTVVFSAAADSVPVEIFKPDGTATDGVDTSRPGFRPFFGTSAAAPHVAAIAALAMQANLSYQLPLFTGFLHTALQQTAVDLGPPGPDTDFGFGRVDALTAVQNEISKARCSVSSDKGSVPVGQPFTITVETSPGAGEPWDIYLFVVVQGPDLFIFAPFNFVTGTFGPINAVIPARPTAAISTSSQSFTFVSPVSVQVGFFCIFGDPGLSRINQYSFVPISITP